MKKTIYSIILTITIVLSTVNVYASNSSNVDDRPSNVEIMTHKEVNNFGRALVTSVLCNDKTYMGDYVDCFTNESLTKIYGFVVNNKVSGNIQSIVIDWVYPKYSDTGDSVMMLNVKIQNNEYNELYLFELHINADGKIYDYNVWAY